MSGPVGSAQTPALPCGAILYRLLTKASQISQGTGHVQPSAFLRRPNDAGLSVFIKDRCSIDEAKQRLSGVKAVVTLHTGRIRDLDRPLDVIPDPSDATHAEIVGVPLQTDDPAEAIYIAELSAKQARVAWRDR